MKGKSFKSLFYIVGRQYLDQTTYLYANGEFILWGPNIVSCGKFKPQLFSNKRDAKSYMKQGDGYTTFLQEVYVEFPQNFLDYEYVNNIY